MVLSFSSRESMIAALSTAGLLLKPLIVVDGVIGTQKNLDWLKEHGYGYLVVSRKRKIDVPSSLEMVTVREDKRRLIRAALINNPDAGEIELYCHSYHVLHAIRFKLGKRGITQSWSTIRKGLSTHMRITTTMKRDDGKMIHIRKFL